MAFMTSDRQFPYVAQYTLPQRRIRSDSNEERPPRLDLFFISDGDRQQGLTNQLLVLPRSKQILLYDSNGKSSIRTERVRFRLRPTYKLISTKPENQRQEIAVVTKRWIPFGKKFDVKSIHGNYSVKKSREPSTLFTLTKNGETVATVEKGPHSRYETNVKVNIDTSESARFVSSLVDILAQIQYSFH